MGDDWPIQEIARLAGTTSRTLRHYGEMGLLAPSRIGSNGYRYYDRDALVRLQRILLLRDLGLRLPAIREVLERQTDERAELRKHLDWLQQEQQRLARQARAVQTTILALEGGEQLMAEEMLDGFDHTRYKEEVERRWGAEAYATSDAWWRSKTDAEKAQFKNLHTQIARDYAAAQHDGESPDSERVQAIVARHVDWLNLSAEATGGRVTRRRLLGYGDMYVGDPRFAANYGGQSGAEFVRDAFRAYAERGALAE